MTTETETREPAAAPRRRKSWADLQSPSLYRVVVIATRLLFRYWVRCFVIEGTEHVPRQGGIFLVANHTTAMDPFIIGVSIPFRMLRGPGKIELFGNPVVAAFMKKLGIFPLRQDQMDAASVRAMVELYRHGRVVAVFPEGGRSETGQLMPFMPEFARLAMRLNARIVPAGIVGGGDLLPVGSLIPRPKTPMAIVYGEEFDLSSYGERHVTQEAAEAAAAHLQSRVQMLVDRAQVLRDRIAVNC